MSGIQDVEANITTYGSHVYLIIGGKAPRYSYTIGNHGRLGFELIFAGGTYYSDGEVHEILNGVAHRLLDELSSTDATDATDVTVALGALGSFTVGEVEHSWRDNMALGAIDYYQLATLKCLQVLPEEKYWTVDIPDLARKLDVAEQPVWKWFLDELRCPVSATSIATTNLDALRGFMVTEAVRWESELWELFSGSGPEVAVEDIRCVPLATLIAFDPSLEAVINLSAAEGIWRDGVENVWHSWKMKNS